MSYDSDFFDAFTGRLSSWKNFSDAQVERLGALAVAQAKHETANWTSNVFHVNNNAVGYRYYSGSLWQVGAGSAGDNGVYGMYYQMEDSARELADWIHRRASNFKTVTTPFEYAAALKSLAYYTDDLNNYATGLAYYYQPADGSGLSEDPPSAVETVLGSLKFTSWFYVIIAAGVFVLLVLWEKPAKMLLKAV